MIIGYLDRCDNTIAGWVVQENDPATPVRVNIYINDELRYSELANLNREDLLSVRNTTHHGFSIDVDYTGLMKASVKVVAQEGSDKLILGERLVTPVSKVEKGVGNWLFLINDSNNTDQALSGAGPETEDEIASCASTAMTRYATLRTLGIPYDMIVMPEKNYVCNSKRLKPLDLSSNRPVKRVLRSMRALSEFEPLYPIARFLSSPDACYYKTDTHASAKGYKIVIEALSQRLPQFYADTILLLKEGTFSGDLAKNLTPSPAETGIVFSSLEESNVDIIENTVDVALKNKTTLTNSLLHYKKDGRNGLLLIFGTSSAFYGLPAFGEPFSEVIFVWSNTIDYHLIALLKPDCVLWVATERCFPITVNDSTGLRVIREKLIGGDK